MSPIPRSYPVRFAPIVLGLFSLMGGCAGPANVVSSGSTISPSPVDRVVLARPVRVTQRAANKNGGVLVLMYHKFAEKETRYDRSFIHFRHDLQRLYDMGFRPVTMSEYLSNRLDIPPGASPVAITLDDSNPTQFRYEQDGTLDPNCAVGIWEEFARVHPDFPVKATWYVLPTVMWGQKKWVNQKIQFLKDSGSELACHTWSHPVLRNLTDRQVKNEIARSLDYLSRYGFDKVSLAYPYGIYPKHMDILDGFWQHHRAYTLTGAVTCDTDIAPAPASDDLKPFKVPRVEALEGPDGIDFWLNRIESRKNSVFVAP